MIHRAEAAARCPKGMWFGPCGGVRHGGGCEVDGRACPFVGDDAPPPDAGEGCGRPASTVGAGAFPGGLAPVMVDVRFPRRAGVTRADTIETWWHSMASALVGCSALLGDHVDALTDDAGPVDPTVAVRALCGGGVGVVATITGRDRDLDGAEVIARRFVGAGASAVHCVTGDHPAVVGVGSEMAFGAESSTLVERVGSVTATTVAESPASPGDRVARVRWKERLGAAVVILNHAGGPGDVIGFVDRCREAGVTLPFVAPVPFVADVETAEALRRFPGVALPTGLLDAVASAVDPRAEGRRWASELTAELAASGRFVGVDLSGGTTSPDPALRLDLTAEFAATTREAWSMG